MPNLATQKPFFFDAAEKVLDIQFASKQLELRSLPKKFWHDVLFKTGIKILSVLQGNFFDAYLLSESTLLVWNDHIRLITCGRSHLLPAAIAILDKAGEASIAQIVFENISQLRSTTELFPFVNSRNNLTAISSREICDSLQQEKPGLFYYRSADQPDKKKHEPYLRLMMHELDATACRAFHDESIEATTIRNQLSLETLFPDYKIDDHVFSPPGYSVNGINQANYYTLHVTPQSPGSYASLESNGPWPLTANALHKILLIFQPMRFDVLTTEEPKELVFGHYTQQDTHLKASEQKESSYFLRTFKRTQDRDRAAMLAR